jgi:SAM-dependent methyltransferase
MQEKITYPFIKNWIKQNSSADAKRVIDFGCGSGDLVFELLSENIDTEGIEVDFFHESILQNLNQALLQDKRIHVIGSVKKLEEFAGRYDLLVSHMVYEHVKNKEEFIRQVASLLNKNGKALLMFPSIEVLRESHIQQFLIHRLPKNKFRYWFSCFQALLGIGYKKSKGVGINEYITGKFEDIDVRCFYERVNVSMGRFNKHFAIAHLEPEYMQYRLNRAGLCIGDSLLKNSFMRVLLTKLLQYYSFTVIEIRKC